MEPPDARLTRVFADGYRNFAGTIDADLPGLTVVFGANNSGKTALTRLPLFVAASLCSDALYCLTSNNVRFAGDFRTLTHVSRVHPSITYGAEWVQGETPCLARILLQLVSTGEGSEEVIPLRIETTSGVIYEARIDDELDIGALNHAYELMVPTRDAMSTILLGALHVPSTRPQVKAVYEYQDRIDAPTPTVQDVPALLAHEPELRATVSSWFEEHLGHRSLAVDNAAFAFRLVSGSGTTGAINMSAAGRGSQAVLPVIALLKAVELGIIQPPLVIVEEPEAHLHPSAQAPLADLLLAVQGAGSRVIVETHSEALTRIVQEAA